MSDIYFSAVVVPVTRKVRVNFPAPAVADRKTTSCVVFFSGCDFNKYTPTAPIKTRSIPQIQPRRELPLPDETGTCPVAAGLASNPA